jgi:hypothetical protein
MKILVGRAERAPQINGFGFYGFEAVETGKTVTISARAKRIGFDLFSIAGMTVESVAGDDFVGL